MTNRRTEPCPICRDVRMTRVRAGIWDDERRSVVACRRCGTVRLDPMPSDAELAALYGNYAEYSRKREARRSYRAALAKTQSRDAVRQLQVVRAHIREKGVLCEIGASRGVFLDAVRPYVRRVFAVEPGESERRVLRKKGIDILASLADAPALDAIAMFHTIEHIRDPLPVLREMRRRLSKGGVVFVETPSIADPLLSMYHSEPFARFYFRREHAFYYSPETLTKLFRMAGFRLVEAHFHQRYGLANHLAWLTTGKPGGDAGLERLFSAADPGYRAALREGKTTDTLVFVFRRP